MFKNHGKFLGGAATAVGVVAVVVGQVTASTAHIKAELRRVEDQAKSDARVSDVRAKSEARRLEDLVKHEEAMRKEAMLRKAAQSDAANQTSKADMFRVLVGFEHQEAVEMTKKKIKDAVEMAKKKNMH